ncbi:MAG: acyl-CoA dehydrogenase family protein [Desulfobacterales bacterium]
MPPVPAGEKIAVLAITEPGGGSDVANIRTTAIKDGDHYVINGSKPLLPAAAGLTR